MSCQFDHDYPVPGLTIVWRGEKKIRGKEKKSRREGFDGRSDNVGHIG